MQERTEAERAFHSAVMFHMAALRCGETLADPENAQREFMLGEPQAVCTAFAAELYLKALVLHRGKRVHGHYLFELYRDQLDDGEKEKVSSHYLTLRNATQSRMQREIRDVSRAFVQWRYSHEVGQESEKALYLDFSALRDFAKALFLATREIAPDWKIEPFLQNKIEAPDRRGFIMAVAKAGHEEEFNRLVARMTLNTHIAMGQPQPNIIEGEDNRFRLSIPTLDFKGQSPTLNVKLGGGADPADYRSD